MDILAIVIGLAAGLFVVIVSKVFAGKPATKRLERYAIHVEERNGFHTVKLDLRADDGTDVSYEIDPNYAHVLSDQVLTASARALREAHAAAR